MLVVRVLMVLLFTRFISHGNSSSIIDLDSDAFSIVIGEHAATIKGEINQILAEKFKGKVAGLHDLYLGILYDSNIKPCIEVISEELNITSTIPHQFEITKEQLKNLLFQETPLVIIEEVNPDKDDNKVDYFDICGEDVPLFSQVHESANILVKENLQSFFVVGITPKGYPSPRCHGPFVPGEKRMDLELKRFHSEMDLPEGTRIVEQHELYMWLEDFQEPHCSMPFLRQQLQTAIELEWSLIPLYFTTLYTIKSMDDPMYIKLKNICTQKLLHFTQAANLLISIGGAPVINSSTGPSPMYPHTGLPGNIALHLPPIPLTKFTIDQIENFYWIEFPSTGPAPASGFPSPPVNISTIGGFYRSISSCFEKLKLQDNVFETKNQITDRDTIDFFKSLGTLYVVDSVQTAQTAIRQIITQGEGETSNNPKQIGGYGYGHYYQFEEIFCGHSLQQVDKTHYQYNGKEISISPSQVWNMPENPNSADMSDCEHWKDFSVAYRDTFSTFQQALSGTPSVFAVAMNRMDDIRASQVSEVFESSDSCGLVWDLTAHY